MTGAAMLLRIDQTISVASAKIVTSPSADFDAFDRLTDRGLIRQEYERYLPLPDSERVGERYYGKGGLVAATLLVCFNPQIQE